MTTADIRSIADRIDQRLRSIDEHEAAIRADLEALTSLTSTPGRRPCSARRTCGLSPRAWSPHERGPTLQRAILDLRDAGGTWHGFVTMGRDETGKAVRRHVRGRTKGAVTEQVAGLEAERGHTAQHAAVNVKQTLGYWLDEWLTHIKRSRKPRTFTTDDALVRTHRRHLMKTKLHDVTVRQIDDLLDRVATTVSPTSAGNLHRTLRAVFSTAVRCGLIPTNPCQHATVPRAIHIEIDPLTVNDVRRVLAAAASEPNAATWSVALAPRSTLDEQDRRFPHRLGPWENRLGPHAPHQGGVDRR